MTVCRTIPVQTVCNSLVPHHRAPYPSSPHQIDPHRSGAIQTGPSLAVPSTDADQGAGMLAVSKDHLYRSPTLQSLQVTFDGRVKYSFKAIQRHIARRGPLTLSVARDERAAWEVLKKPSDRD